MEWLLRVTAEPASLQAAVETSSELKLRTYISNTRSQCEFMLRLFLFETSADIYQYS